MRAAIKYLLPALLLLTSTSFAHDPEKLYDSSSATFFNVPPKHIASVRERALPQEELPAVLHISELASALPSRIADLRQEKKSWRWIMETFNVGPDDLYVPVKTEEIKPPFAKLYGYFNSKQKSEWRSIKLDDAEVIDLANLRFLSRFYGVKPEGIMRKREEGESYVAISHTLHKTRRPRR